MENNTAPDASPGAYNAVSASEPGANDQERPRRLASELGKFGEPFARYLTLHTEMRTLLSQTPGLSRLVRQFRETAPDVWEEVMGSSAGQNYRAPQE